jgi:hypothetical protein
MLVGTILLCSNSWIPYGIEKNPVFALIALGKIRARITATGIFINVW